MKKVAATAILGALTVVAGCATQAPKQRDFVEVDGHRLPLNEQGQVELTSEQYQRLVKAEAVVLTEDELRLLKSDRDAFYGVMGQEGEEGLTLLLSKGSLKEALADAVRRVAPVKVVWLAPHDYHLNEPFAIVADNLELAVAEALFDFPLSPSFEEKDGVMVIAIKSTEVTSP